MAAQSSLYNEDRNLLRIREKERRNQEAHQDKEAFSEKIPLFGEPYKTEKGDELSSRIQNMLGDYEEMKEFLSSKSHPQRLDASENRLGKPRYPLFPEKGSSIPPHSFHTSVHHQPVNTPACGPLPDGNISHHPRMAQPRMEPMPSLHAKSYGPPDSQHLTQERLGQEGYGSSHHKKGDRRADGDHCALTTDSAPERELSPLLSLPSPVPPLSPVHSNQQTAPRMQGSGKVPSSSSSNKGYCLAKSPKDLAVKVHDKETPQDSTGAVASLGVAPPQPPSQTFPPPSLPSKSLAMQQKPTAYVRPMDGQDQAPSESPELKPLPEEYRQQTFEKSDLKVPAKAKLTKLKMPSQSVEQTYSNEVHCVEEILKEMTHSWPPPLTAIHTPSTAEPSKFPFPTKDSQHISSAVPNQKQYDTSSKTHSNSQQGTSMLKDDLQLSDSEEDSDSDQTSEKPAFAPAPPSAPPALPAAEASAHSSSAESESTSDSDSSSDSESESSSSDSEENEPREAPAPEPEPPTTNKWQLDNWLTKVSQPAVPTEAPGSTEPPARHPDTKGKGGDSIAAGHERPESKELPPKGSNKAPRVPSEGPHSGKRSCQKSPAQQEPPQRQTVGSKQPKKPIKASAPGHTDAPADARACLQVESEPGLPPPASKDQPSKDKPKVKTKGRPRAADSREPKPAVPTPSDRKKHRSGPPKAPPKDAAAEDRSPEHFALVPLTQSQGPVRGGAGARTSGCRLAVVVQEDRRKDKPPVPSRDTKLLSPLRDAPPPQSLVVKITLDLLSRIPQPPGKGSRPKKPEDKQPPAGKKPDPEKRSSENASKLAKKRKGEAEKDHDSKKVRLEKEVKSQPSSSSSHKEPSKSKMSRPSSEPSKKEMLPPSLVSSSSSQKPAKPAQKRPRQEDPGGQDPPKSASSTKGSHRDPSASKHRKAEGKVFGSSTEHKGSSGDTANRFPVPSLPNGNSKPGKPHVKFDKQQADFHLKEAKRLKDKAELVTDKVGKAFKYLEAALSFIECGVALESESPASKSAYSIYSETVDLIKFILSLKSFSDATTPTQEKIFAVLCMRCQSILNMAMFRCKKDMAIKYSRTLNEHFFKTSSKVAQAPSPCIARSTGTPSPLSPIPSPASSIGSQSSAGSVGSGALPATISTPVTIQNMTSSYVSITSHVLTAFDLWEQAEVLTRKNKEFFAQLSTSVCALALNSSLMDLVHYTRQGFQRLKQVTKTP